MIQESDIRHIAKLGRLSLADAEVATYAAQLDRVLGFFEQLTAIDTAGVPLTAHPLPLANAFRPDAIMPTLALEQVLANAPQPEGAYFRVPRILES